MGTLDNVVRLRPLGVDRDEKQITLRPSLSALGEVTDIETMAAYLQVHHKTLRGHIATYKSHPDIDPPGVMRIGRTIRITVSVFIAWLEDGLP